MHEDKLHVQYVHKPQLDTIWCAVHVVQQEKCCTFLGWKAEHYGNYGGQLERVFDLRDERKKFKL